MGVVPGGSRTARCATRRPRLTTSECNGPRSTDTQRRCPGADDHMEFATQRCAAAARLRPAHWRVDPLTVALRYQRNRPGRLVQLGFEKLGRIPPGGGGRPPRRSANQRDHLSGHRSQACGSETAPERVDAAGQLPPRPPTERPHPHPIDDCTGGSIVDTEPLGSSCGDEDGQRQVRELPNRDLTGAPIAKQKIRSAPRRSWQARDSFRTVHATSMPAKPVRRACGLTRCQQH
jgi:hypothetical protein